MNYRITAYTEEAKEMLSESGKRTERIFGSHDQLTGENMELHGNHVYIPDMVGLEHQWLNDEVYESDLYRMVREAGTISSFLNKANSELAEGQEEWTFEDIYNGLVAARVSGDPSFAFYVCFEIKYKGGGTGQFELNYAQRELLVELELMRCAGKPIRIVLCKARQWGGSTLVQLYMAWIQLFVKEQWNSVIVAQVKDTAKVIKGMYTRVIGSMPALIFNTPRIQFTPNEKATDEFIISDGKNRLRDNTIGVSSYEAFEGLRGHDYAMAHLSEFAYWKTTKTKTASDVITNIEGGIDPNPYTLIIIESTARGNSGPFYERYQIAKDPDVDSIYKAVFIPFYHIEKDSLPFRNAVEKLKFAEWILEHKDDEVPVDKAHESGRYIYNLWLKGASLEHIHWYVLKRTAFTDHAQMAREAPSDDVECFVFSGNKVFNPEVIDLRRQQQKKDPMFRGEIHEKQGQIALVANSTGQFWIWRGPDRMDTEYRYLVVVDPGGRSESSDPNVITVIDRWPMVFGGVPEVVARWRGHIRYDLLAYKAVKIARLYNNALLAIESNTYDKKKAESSEFTEQADHIDGILLKIGKSYTNLYKRKSTSPEDIRKGRKTKIGFHTNPKTKQKMIDVFVVDVEEDKWIDPDDRMWAEAGIYEQKEDGSYGNIDGKDNHDDILMTDMIGDYISTYEMPMPRIRTAVTDIPVQVRMATRNESSL